MRPFADPDNEGALFAGADLAAERSLAGASLDAAGPDATVHVENVADGALRVVAFDGVEEVNALYFFDIVFLAAPGTDDLVASALGAPVRLRLGPRDGHDAVPDSSRWVHGIAGEVSLLSAGAVGRLYRLRLVPGLAALAFTRQSRVFQELSGADVVAEVLRAHHLRHRFALAQPGAKRAYCVQYEESDLDFVVRLLAEEGWELFFEHGGDDDAGASAGEEIVIADSPHAHEPLRGGDRFTVRPATSALAGATDHIHELTALRRLASNEVSARDFDFERATRRAGLAIPTPSAQQGTAHVAGVSSATARVDEPDRPGPMSFYEHHGQYGDVEIGRARAAAHLAQLRALSAENSGRSAVRRLLPGRTVRITHPEAEHLDGAYLITRVVHRGRDAASPEGLYHNRFRAVLADTVQRPERPARRVIQTMESAVVVGAAGQEIATDGWGSVRVQFHWDRKGTNDERSSCFLRVAQAWSGPGYGFQFVPRIGSEVLVSFLGGDPDRPVIVGSLPNSANPLPYPLPLSATQSGIRTRSTPEGGGGHNELLFDDKAGGELVRMRAERDHEELVLRDQRVSVGRNVHHEIGGERDTSVGAADLLRVGAAQVTHVGGDVSRTVAGNLSDAVVGHAHTHVGKDRSLRIEGSSITTVGGSVMLIAGHEVPGNIQIQATDICRITGKNAVNIQSSTGIDLVCGTTRLSLRPDGIEIRAERVKISSPDIELGSDASRIAVTDSILLASDSVVAEAASAYLSLDDKAVLQGDKVDLRGPKKRTKASSDSSTAAPEEAVFQFVPPAGMRGPFTLRFATPTGEVIERDADASHEVRLKGAPGERFVLLEVRSGDRVLHHMGEDEDDEPVG